MCVTIGLSETGWGRPGLAMVATVDRSGPADLVAASTRLPAGGDDLVAGGAGGHGHGHVDVAALAEEDPLEPVLLGPGQVPDEAEQAGPGRQAGVRCCSAVSPADIRTAVARPGEEVQQHLALGFRHLAACAVTRTHAA
jgi:hypothetical protein